MAERQISSRSLLVRYAGLMVEDPRDGCDILEGILATTTIIVFAAGGFGVLGYGFTRAFMEQSFAAAGMETPAPLSLETMIFTILATLMLAAFTVALCLALLGIAWTLGKLGEFMVDRAGKACSSIRVTPPE